MPAPTSSQIRQRFIDFFVIKHNHRLYPSSPVVPHNDPTLMFANAGMNQFKPAFLGQITQGSPLHGLIRAVNTQKCIRAGGKHNDLEDVGKDTYHHTFFEMLGNWSLGDYFKDEAIAWAWELLTDEFAIPADRLYATYFQGDASQGLEPDDEARNIWLKYLPQSRVLPGNMKDNFWEMGETGPCGPCSEIHYDRIGDRDAAPLVNQDDPNVLEIWNLVFIQFDRQANPSGTDLPSGTGVSPVRPSTILKPLPAKHVDTGMGLERLTSVLQNKPSNYDTDLFTPIFEAIQKSTGARAYAAKLGDEDPDQIDTAYRVIADHARTLTFAIADGAVPSNEGRGYVLRRVLRRAVRYGRQMLGAEAGFLAGLVPVVVEEMGEAFPELRKKAEFVREVVHDEEESFGRTLDRGIRRFEEAEINAWRESLGDDWAFLGQLSTIHFGDYSEMSESRLRRLFEHRESKKKIIAGDPDSFDVLGDIVVIVRGEDAFQLYDTYGFPLDLTQLMAKERGLTVDVDGFHRCMDEQRKRSQAAIKSAKDGLTLPADAIAKLQSLGVHPTHDAPKYDHHETSATVRAIWHAAEFHENIAATSAGLHRVGVLLDKTCFYAEAGGQVADTGHLTVTREAHTSPTDEHKIGKFRVEHVQSFGGYVLHVGLIEHAELRVGDTVTATIDQARRSPTQANHTMTHAMNLALREVLGDGVDQKGSLVTPERLRFDFSHNKPVTSEQIEDIETITRDQIARDLSVFTDIVPLADAKKINTLRAVFGEVYPDPVRVVSIGAPIDEMLADPSSERWAAYSVEFCGGTHLAKTSQAGDFSIVAETGVAKGIRRIEALTGVPARAARASAESLAEHIDDAAKLDNSALKHALAELSNQIDSMTISVSDKAKLRASHAELLERVKAADKLAAKARAAVAIELAQTIADTAKDAGGRTIVEILDLAGDRRAMQQAMQTIRDTCPDAGVLLLSAHGDAVAISASVPQALIERGLKAGDWVRTAAQACDGKGGGKPDQAQGGGKDASKIDAAADTAQEFATAALA